MYQYRSLFFAIRSISPPYSNKSCRNLLPPQNFPSIHRTLSNLFMWDAMVSITTSTVDKQVNHSSHSTMTQPQPQQTSIVKRPSPMANPSVNLNPKCLSHPVTLYTYIHIPSRDENLPSSRSIHHWTSRTNTPYICLSIYPTRRFNPKEPPPPPKKKHPFFFYPQFSPMNGHD